MKTNLIKQLAITGLAALTFGLSGCKNDVKYDSYRKIDVDQVFKNSWGYELIHRDKEKMMRIENVGHACQGIDFASISKEVDTSLKLIKRVGVSAWDFNHIYTTIFQDLPQNERGYAYIVKFAGCSVAEVHLPENQGLTPGNEIIHCGKSCTREEPVQEIK